MKNWKPVLSLFFIILLLPLGVLQNKTETAPSNQSAVIAIDSSTKIVNAEWSDEGVTLVFQSDMPRVATITDFNSMPLSGAGQVNFKRVRLAPGETTVQMQTSSSRGSMTVKVGVGNSLVAVSNPSKPLLSDIRRSTVYIGIISGITTSLALVVGIVWYRKRKYGENFYQIA